MAMVANGIMDVGAVQTAVGVTAATGATHYEVVVTEIETGTGTGTATATEAVYHRAIVMDVVNAKGITGRLLSPLSKLKKPSTRKWQKLSGRGRRLSGNLRVITWQRTYTIAPMQRAEMAKVLMSLRMMSRTNTRDTLSLGLQ
jgi:hypothetical protein